MLLKSTTRHVRIFTAEVVDEELKFHPNKLTLDLDPDNEFIWNHLCRDIFGLLTLQALNLIQKESSHSMKAYRYYLILQ